MTAALGIVIPALNEAGSLPALLADLAALRPPADIVVVDGGSTDGTTDLAAAAGARVLRAAPGRGSQLLAGAAAARGAWLCFLHADVRMPEPARADLERTIADPTCDAAVWRLAIDARGWWYRAVEWGAARRHRLLGLAYGDQGLLVRRARYHAAGGYPPWPVLEDVALVRALRAGGSVRRLPSSLLVSARRWEREGPVRTWVRNTVLVSAYLAGVPPARLARWYRPEPGDRARSS